MGRPRFAGLHHVEDAAISVPGPKTPINAFFSRIKSTSGNAVDSFPGSPFPPTTFLPRCPQGWVAPGPADDVPRLSLAFGMEFKAEPSWPHPRGVPITVPLGPGGTKGPTDGAWQEGADPQGQEDQKWKK